MGLIAMFLHLNHKPTEMGLPILPDEGVPEHGQRRLSSVYLLIIMIRQAHKGKSRLRPDQEELSSSFQRQPICSTLQYPKPDVTKAVRFNLPRNKHSWCTSYRWVKA